MFALTRVKEANPNGRHEEITVGTFDTLDAAQVAADNDARARYNKVTHWHGMSSEWDYTRDVMDGVYYVVREVGG